MRIATLACFYLVCTSVYGTDLANRPAVRMEHSVLYKKAGHYSGWPLPSQLPDGRLSVVVHTSPIVEHFALGDRITLVSDDQGATWSVSDDLTIPANWPGSSTREKYDRYATVLKSGRYLAAGGVGWEVWPGARRQEAEQMGLNVRPHPDQRTDEIVVGGHKMYVQWSDDQGTTWTRREWVVPRATRFNTFPRSAHLKDGTILVPAYDIGLGKPEVSGSVYVVRVTHDRDCRLIEFPGRGGYGNELALIETSPGTVLALIRDFPGTGYLLESWSEDSGKTWSHAVQTKIWGYPPHLLRLRDGRILCSYGYRREPMGIRAVLSSDGGRSWDLKNEMVLRDDAVAKAGNRLGENSPGDLGYPISVQLADGSIFTAYYFVEEDAVVHAAATRWWLPKSKVSAELQQRCLALLRRELRSAEFRPSIHAAEALTALDKKAGVVDVMQQRLASERDDPLRCGFLREMVRAGDDSQLDSLFGVLAKPDEIGQIHAAESLYKINRIGDGRALRTALESRNERVGVMAAAALARRGSESALSYLRKRLAHEDLKIARLAAWVLARVGDESDIPALRTNLQRARTALTRCYFEHALANLGDAAGQEALARNLTSDDPLIRTYAATFAGEAGMSSVIDPLVELLDDPDADARVRAAHSLLELATRSD